MFASNNKKVFFVYWILGNSRPADFSDLILGPDLSFVIVYWAPMTSKLISKVTSYSGIQNHFSRSLITYVFLDTHVSVLYTCETIIISSHVRSSSIPIDPIGWWHYMCVWHSLISMHRWSRIYITSIPSFFVFLKICVPSPDWYITWWELDLIGMKDFDNWGSYSGFGIQVAYLGATLMLSIQLFLVGCCFLLQ